MSNYLLSIRDQLSVYLSLHSYGQYWLTPWGFTYQVPVDYDEMVGRPSNYLSSLLQYSIVLNGLIV